MIKEVLQRLREYFCSDTNLVVRTTKRIITREQLEEQIQTIISIDGISDEEYTDLARLYYARIKYYENLGYNILAIKERGSVIKRFAVGTDTIKINYNSQREL